MLQVEGGSQQRGREGSLQGGRYSSGTPSGESLEQVRRSTSAAGLKHTQNFCCVVCYRDMYSVDSEKREIAPTSGEWNILQIKIIVKFCDQICFKYAK